MSHAQAPPNAQLRVINPHVGAALKGLPCTLPASGRTKLGGKQHFIGGVSSFGYSGTIAHAVLESDEPRGVTTRLASAILGRPLAYRRYSFPWPIADARPSANGALGELCKYTTAWSIVSGGSVQQQGAGTSTLWLVGN